MKYLLQPKFFVLIVCLFFFIMPLGQASNKDGVSEVTIHVALYSSISPSVRLLFNSFNYTWESNGTQYRFSVTEIGRTEVLGGGKKLHSDNYDVVVIGASGRQYFHALQPAWRHQMIDFLEQGGGYLGICGGANIASQGLEQPDSLLGVIINQGLLGIANIYINDDQNEEWQYLWKDTGEDHIPVPLTLTRVSHPLYQGYDSPETFITYGGGPGMYPADSPDPRLGDLTPLAFFAEEPSAIAPLNYWQWRNGEWMISDPVRTDIKGQYAVVSTLYNTTSRLILFSPHPEIPPMFDGHIEEFLGFSIYGILRYVYRWTGGLQTENDYNWWMIRRAAAWVSHIPVDALPPVPS